MLSCYHVLATALDCYLGILEKIKKDLHRLNGPKFAYSLALQKIIGNMASIGQFYRYLLRRCSCELVEWVPFHVNVYGQLNILEDCILLVLRFKDFIMFISLCSQTITIFTLLFFKI